MDYVLKAGRSLTNGVWRVVCALTRGTQRILAYVIPLLSITEDPKVTQEENADPPTGGEDAENAAAAASSPEEKSAASSPSADEQVAAPTAAAAAESKEEADAASPAVAASPVEEKKKDPTPSAPTPVPSAEDKKEEAVEKVEVEKKVAEVSQSAGGQSVPKPVSGIFYRFEPVAARSIIEKKANEDLPPLPPSSPPPTPIDPSPLQQDRQVAANATALAEALKLPAVTADEEEPTLPPDVAYPSSREKVFFQELRASEPATTMLSRDSFTDNLPLTLATFVPDVECLPVVKAEIEVETSQDAAKKVGETLENSFENKKEDSIGMEKKVSTPEANKKVIEYILVEAVLSEDAKKVPDVAAMAKVMNEVLPVAECQTKSEINTCEVAMKINALPNAELGEKVKTETMLLDENEKKTPCLIKHDVTPEEIDRVLNEVDKSLNRLENPAVDLNNLLDLEHPFVEHLKSVETMIDAQSEVLDELIKDVDILIEAKPAVVIPEDDTVEKNTDTNNVVKAKSTSIISEDDTMKKNIDTNNVAKAKPVPIIPENGTVEKNTDPNNIAKAIPETDESEDYDPLPLEDMDMMDSNSTNSSTLYTLDEMDGYRANENENENKNEDEDEYEEEIIAIEIEDPQECRTEDIFKPQMSLLNYTDFSVPKDHSNKFHTLDSVSDPENAAAFLEDLPPAPEDQGSQSLDSFDYPLPPEDLSCPSLLIAPPNMSVTELSPAPVEHAASPRDPTETLLPLPISPSFQSNITPDIAAETATKDRSQIPSYYENDNNRKKSMLLSEPLTMSYNQSDVELKERLVAERVAKTESQEEALSCQLSNSIPSTATKEHHQNAHAPEVEAPVENNIAHDVSTTESVDEAPIVAPPAIPFEAPATPPTAPAITEDVASVTKAIEEIGISDKAVAAAVNEAIESNTNEIITDAHYQNNLNE